MIAIGGATARDSRQFVREHAASLALAALHSPGYRRRSVHYRRRSRDDGELYSFAESLWWSTTTITTVGYGDIAPTSAAGRIVAGVTMIVGISTFAVVTAKVAEFLVRIERTAYVPVIGRT